MPRRRPTLAEPVICGRFWRNRAGHAIYTRLLEFNGQLFVDVRTFFCAKDGKMLPSPKGLTLGVRRLPDLAKAVNKALVQAQELAPSIPKMRVRSSLRTVLQSAFDPIQSPFDPPVFNPPTPP